MKKKLYEGIWGGQKRTLFNYQARSYLHLLIKPCHKPQAKTHHFTVHRALYASHLGNGYRTVYRCSWFTAFMYACTSSVNSVMFIFGLRWTCTKGSKSTSTPCIMSKNQSEMDILKYTTILLCRWIKMVELLLRMNTVSITVVKILHLKLSKTYPLL